LAVKTLSSREEAFSFGNHASPMKFLKGIVFSLAAFAASALVSTKAHATIYSDVLYSSQDGGSLNFQITVGQSTSSPMVGDTWLYVYDQYDNCYGVIGIELTSNNGTGPGYNVWMSDETTSIYEVHVWGGAVYVAGLVPLNGGYKHYRVEVYQDDYSLGTPISNDWGTSSLTHNFTNSRGYCDLELTW
jgi:hypothetical protein